MSTYEELVEESKQHKNELVLEGWTVVMLLEGIHDDGEDYYWRYLRQHHGMELSSCVGGHHYLKGELDTEVYDRLLELFKMNYMWWYKKQKSDVEKLYSKSTDRIDNEMAELLRVFGDKK